MSDAHGAGHEAGHRAGHGAEHELARAAASQAEPDARHGVDASPRDTTTIVSLDANDPTRRQLLGTALAGFSGLVLATQLLPGCAAAKPAAATTGDDELVGDPSLTWEPDLFLALDGTGAVTIVAHRSEMGTGIRTALPMALADELGADWSRVGIVQAPGDAAYGSQNTDGSRSVRRFLEPLRRVGASARTLLERAAARRWGVDPSDVRAEAHFVRHAPSGRRLPFGALVADAAALPVPAAEDVLLRGPDEWRYMAKGVPSVDLADMLTGHARFGLDASPPGTLTAVVERSPVLGGRLVRYDREAALAVPGVTHVLELEAFSAPHAFQPLGGVAVVAHNTWAAMQGRAALNVLWDDGFNSDYDSPGERAELVAAVSSPARVVRDRGDVEAALAGASTTLSATYETPLLAHAPMEPPCALAHVTDDGATCWAPTQNPQAAQGQVAASLGLDPARVTVHVTLLGGGFGRKSKPDMLAEAALLSRQTGTPVKLVWTREDDIRHDYYHACSALHCEAGLDADGRPVAWLQRSAFPSISSSFAPGVRQGSAGELGLGFIDVPIDVPHLRVENGEATAQLRIGWLRAVCNVFHAFGVQSFADEVAHARGLDPLQNLLELMGPARLLDPADDGAEYGNYGEPLERYPIDTGRLEAVTRLVAERAGWGRELPRGRGLGIASHRSFLSYVGVVVEVDVSREGRLSIPRVDVAIDCGLALDPDRVRAQMEGSMVFGTSLASSGAITAKDGRIEQSNFHDYPVARMGDAPRAIHVHLLQNKTLPPGGVGEPGVPPVAPALCNAIFAATGQRVRRLPLSLHDLSWS
ncbi:MAG: xanthine dehydrogenase family protein molybdopterin-binding subunit [Planctomycetota bacterium]|nr:MAG: xanthine dehydrogenase family protein molybdopterin-binding subunit [Planctomycetota bacterium]